MSRASLTQTFVFALVGICGGTVQVAVAIQLNGPLAPQGNIGADFRFTPDSGRVMYVAEQSVHELFSVPSAGGTPATLCGTMTPGGHVVGIGEFTANSAQALFRADRTTDEQFELYRVASAGGTPERISGPMVSIGDVDPTYRVSTDGNRALYIANAETNAEFQVYWQLYSVPTAGGTPVNLSGSLIAGGSVERGSAKFSADGSRAFFLGDKDTDAKRELYSVVATGGAPVKLNATIVPGGGDVELPYQVSSDGTRVLYVADQNTDQLLELFSVPAAGGTAVKLNATLPSTGDVDAASPRFSPNGVRVIYLADQQTDGVAELFSVPSTGGTPVKLNGALVMGGDVSLAGLQFTPDGSRVIYGADQLLDQSIELFSVPATGGTAVRLNAPFGTLNSVDMTSVAFNLDGSRVLYRANQDDSEKMEVYSVPVVGGAPMKLSSSLVLDGDVLEARFTPDGSRVIYLADQDVDQVFELYSVASTGGASVRISESLIPGGDVTDWQISPNGQRVVYRADQDEDEVFELFSVELGSTAVMLGDFNNDRVVDAADYTVWRNGLGTGAYEEFHYDIWRQHYGDGMTGPGGGGLAVGANNASESFAAVPEPATVWLVMVAACAITTGWLRSRRTKRRV